MIPKALIMKFQRSRQLISQQGRKAAGLATVHEHLCHRLVTSIALAESATEMDRTTVARRLKDLIDLGLVRKLNGLKRNQLFAYDPYLAILSEGTEPLEA